MFYRLVGLSLKSPFSRMRQQLRQSCFWCGHSHWYPLHPFWDEAIATVPPVDHSCSQQWSSCGSAKGSWKTIKLRLLLTHWIDCTITYEYINMVWLLHWHRNWYQKGMVSVPIHFDRVDTIKIYVASPTIQYFPERGANVEGEGSQPIILPKFLKNYIKMKKIGPQINTNLFWNIWGFIPKVVTRNFIFRCTSVIIWT